MSLIDMLFNSRKEFTYATFEKYLKDKSDSEILKECKKLYNLGISNSRFLLYYASFLFCHDREQESLEIYQVLLKYPVSRIEKDFDLGNSKEIKGLKNDLNFRIAKCYYYLNEFDKAIYYTKKHIDKLPLPTENEEGEPAEYLQFLKRVKKFEKDCELYHKAANEYDWRKAIEHLKNALKFDETEHWVWIQLARMYLNLDGDPEALSLALKSIKKAYSLTKECPETLFYYGYSLELNGKYSEAKNIYRMIIKKGIDVLSYGVCGEGLRYGRGYYADSLFRLGICYQKEGKKSLSKKYIQKHLAMRGPGMVSIFSKKVVLKHMRKLESS